jgi:glutamate synthase (NADPH/NADH) large chain
VVLGPTGRNFGAGMSGGIAYVYDGDGTFRNRLNPEMVDVDPLEEEDREWLRDTVRTHGSLTGSTVAASLLDRWQLAVRHFVKVMPKDYKRVLEAAREAEERGLSVDEAIMAASHG